MAAALFDWGIAANLWLSGVAQAAHTVRHLLFYPSMRLSCLVTEFLEYVERRSGPLSASV